MAKRKRYPAWEVSWEQRNTDTGRWRRHREVLQTQAAARWIVADGLDDDETYRKTRIRPLTYADTD